MTMGVRAAVLAVQRKRRGKGAGRLSEEQVLSGTRRLQGAMQGASLLCRSEADCGRMPALVTPPRTVQDLDLWRRLASMSTEQGFLRQAIYCLNKVLHQPPCRGCLQ